MDREARIRRRAHEIWKLRRSSPNSMGRTPHSCT
ncbi:MAG: DUF2934 domain-containing protein, partial [Mesorhizobium sp.]